MRIGIFGGEPAGIDQAISDAKQAADHAAEAGTALGAYGKDEGSVLKVADPDGCQPLVVGAEGSEVIADREGQLRSDEGVQLQVGEAGEGVALEDDVFIGHNVVFTNDRYPRATNAGGQLQTEADWKCVPTLVKRGASVGSGAVLLCGITICENAMIGAGSVVTKDVPADTIVAGNPARVVKSLPKKSPC